MNTQSARAESENFEGEGDVITASRITKEYLDGAFVSLKDASLSFGEDEFVVFLGPSGCGKTTMLRILAGLEYPTRGELTMQGEPIVGPGPDRGMIFQAYTSLPWLTALQNIEYGMKIIGIPTEERHKKAKEMLELVHLEKFADLYPASMSGGMKQRVAIARTLAQEPKVLLMDEPFGALDAQVRWEMQEMMIDVINKSRKTIIMVTHDIQEAIFLADRIVFFTRSPGQIKADIKMEFKKGQRINMKEDCIVLPGYTEMEKELFAMMREEIQAL